MNFRKIYSGQFLKNSQNSLKKYGASKGREVQKEHGFVNGKYVDNYILGLFRSIGKKWK